MTVDTHRYSSNKRFSRVPLTSSTSRSVSPTTPPWSENPNPKSTNCPRYMASCDDDFALLGDETDSHHHHHQHPHQATTYAPHRFVPKNVGNDAASDDYADTAFDAKCPPPVPEDVGFVCDDDDDKSRDYSSKKPKPVPSSYSGDCRKDREEWSDSAIGCLLDAYTEKYMQLNRGNLRGRDWEEVASIVSDRCDKQKSSKSVDQCKNKVDNLKKRYKVEQHRMSSNGIAVSHWTWFKKMEQIVGSSAAPSSSKGVSDEDNSTSALRQSKRYAVATPSPVGFITNMKTKPSTPRWRRVVLKISGAALAGNGPQNVDPKVTMLIAREVAMANRHGVEVAIVVGGRNFFCGDTWVAATALDRTSAYQIGMMATVMNSILLQASLEKLGVQTRVQTAFPMQEIAEPYIRRRAIRHLEKGRVVIFGGIGAGTGNPLFTTDTAAALRASEINADAILKGTNVDGVYDCHSRNSNMAFEHISFRELVSRGVTAMDMTAITFCEENGIPVVVFNLLEPGNISRALCGDQVGILIDQTGRIG